MAYEFNKLVDKLKAKGLDVAEDGAKVILNCTIEFLMEEASASENKLDDIIIPLAMALKPMADAQIDKIDGKIG